MRISDWSSDVCSSDLNHGVEYTPANGIVNRLVKYFPTARVADQDGRLTLKKIGAGKLSASAAPAVRLGTVGAPGWPGARRGLLSRRLPVAGVLLVQLHRRHRALGAAADPQVDHFDEHRERHRRVDVALRDVLAEAVGDQHQADHDQEAQRENLARGVALDRSEEHKSELQ